MRTENDAKLDRDASSQKFVQIFPYRRYNCFFSHPNTSPVFLYQCIRLFLGRNRAPHFGIAPFNVERIHFRQEICILLLKSDA